MRLSRHPQFVKFLSQLPRTEVGTHGLHHVRRGTSVPVEFQGLDGAVCRRLLQQMLMIFDEAGLEYAPGMAPPGWELSDDLANAMVEVGLKFVASARDIRTAVSPDATTNMSGMKGVSLIFPELIVGGHLLHITSNFQATSTIERAIQIIENGGLLAIKAHAVKNALGHIALDGLDELYRNYLDLIFTTLESKYGDSLWWTTMGQIAGRCMNGDETLRATGANS
ncbi:MAG: hypothetical protein QOH63_2971 [Acidobacteriota bacterium]|nr:hypothetical protein [Acidobacteriota bacterium]